MKLSIVRALTLGTLLLVCTATCHAQLGAALNATNLLWTTSGTGGASGWSAQSATTHDGVSAAGSSTLTSGSRTSRLQTTVTGPGTLSFWWQSASFIHTLSFTVNGVTFANIGGSTSWQLKTFYLDSGNHALEWVYSSNTSGSNLDRGYLDEVSFHPGPVAPRILTPPPSQSQVPGLAATFTVVTEGAPLAYQWRFNDADIPGATMPTLTITNVQTTNLGLYHVIVTNELGSAVSSSASLEFGNVTAWGMIDPSGPPTVASGLSNVIAVACGPTHSLALTAEGALIAWENSFPPNAPSDLTNVIAIAAGKGLDMALRSDGSVVAWGSFTYSPTNVPPNLTNAVAIAGSERHALALRADGTVVAWATGSTSSTNVPAGLSNVVAITAGDSYSVAVRRDGTVLGWGLLGAGPINIPTGLTDIVAIAAGLAPAMALRSDGTVTAWGNNRYGQTNVPPELSNVVAIRAGYYHNLALKSDGTVVAWGNGTYGQTALPVGLTNVTAISARVTHNLAIVGDGPPIETTLALNPILSTNGFSLTVPSQSGRVFSLEYKDSLADENWNYLPLVAGTGKTLTLTDPTATNSTQRYYRVRRW